MTGRLPKELADEVVESVLELFTLAEGDAAWHGGMCNRHSLSPKMVLPYILSNLGQFFNNYNFYGFRVTHVF